MRKLWNEKLRLLRLWYTSEKSGNVTFFCHNNLADQTLYEKRVPLLPDVQQHQHGASPAFGDMLEQQPLHQRRRETKTTKRGFPDVSSAADVLAKHVNSGAITGYKTQTIRKQLPPQRVTPWDTKHGRLRRHQIHVETPPCAPQEGKRWLCQGWSRVRPRTVSWRRPPGYSSSAPSAETTRNCLLLAAKRAST